MNQLADAARTGGNRMKTLGIIAIILGMFAMLAPGLTGLSVAIIIGIKLFFVGLIMVMGGSAVRSIAKE